jgi:hypothetical protein
MLVTCTTKGQNGQKDQLWYNKDEKRKKNPGGVTGEFFHGIRQFHVPGVDSTS